MQKRWSQVINQVWLGLGAIVITACSNDGQKIAEQIQQGITVNGGTLLQTVTCPQGVKLEADESFDCVGKMDNGYTFTIPVKLDAKGTLTWDVPHAKGLINVPKLESVIQENLTTEIGTKPTVSCGDLYKSVKPGEGFECQLSYKKLKPVAKPTKPFKGKSALVQKPIEITQTEKVNVTTDDSGNVSWQRILPKVAVKPKTSSLN